MAEIEFREVGRSASGVRFEAVDPDHPKTTLVFKVYDSAQVSGGSAAYKRLMARLQMAAADYIDAHLEEGSA
jgi:hypothetical protein